MRPLHVTAGALAGDRLADGRYLLGVVGFGAPRPPLLDPHCPFIQVGLPLLQTGAAYEAWVSPSPPTLHRHGHHTAVSAGDMLFGVIEAGGQTRGMHELACRIYCDLFGLVDRLGCQNVLRVFNYLPRITAFEDGIERYRAFNAGRHAAFETCGRDIEAAPAACALGTKDGAPVVYFIASGSPGRAVENPRQDSAYRYPPRYGARSPSFSRAMLHVETRHLFISGTASIVGHESLHPGDAGAQVDETLRNMQALLERCGRDWPDVAESLLLKVYVKRRADVPLIRRHLAVLPNAGMMLLEADICRDELLVEAEAWCAFE